ncbi:hypothetical protein IWQ60_005226 [Tieghemiomyces parasiticus]|uniref:Uncharacterized protein n=1 Tax=Tieghemiomyces parasiticus TaxID=78921 RepID=A0A9W8AA09_9FUNG|nr:hypothetical protein IWQ60_005226 [Tieghemiomyces parasiticus]
MKFSTSLVLLVAATAAMLATVHVHALPHASQAKGKSSLDKAGDHLDSAVTSTKRAVGESINAGKNLAKAGGRLVKGSVEKVHDEVHEHVDGAKEKTRKVVNAILD